MAVFQRILRWEGILLIDLHIHSREGSDGRMPLKLIFEEAERRGLSLLSITDHDSMESQAKALVLARDRRISYISGLELNISFSHRDYRDGKPFSLDCLGYGVDIDNISLLAKLEELRAYRRRRAQLIMDKVNGVLVSEGKPLLGDDDIREVMENVDGTFGRPHIADHLVKKNLAASRQEAFDRYLVRCNVPKMPVSLEEAASLIRGAGGVIVLAHPNNPRGTSLYTMTKSLDQQQRIIKEAMLSHLDGLECWHSSHDLETVSSYLKFARDQNMTVTGGSDCHQQPLIIGTVNVPAWVAGQHELKKRVLP